MEEQNRFPWLAFATPILFIVVLILAGIFLFQDFYTTSQTPNQVACTQEALLCSDGSYVGRTGPNCEFAACPSTGISGLLTYSDAQNRFQFQYPQSFNTSFASFQNPPVGVVNTQSSSKIDTKGCYIPDAQLVRTSQVTLGANAFCLTESQDVGAGQLYHIYQYTTLRNGNYMTLEYVVHTSNGCGAYSGLPQFNECTTFMSNYDSIVMTPINNSAATLTFNQ